MDIKYKLYPYPVLAEFTDDYKNSSFDTQISVNRSGYNMIINFNTTMNNEELYNLISQGNAKFVYHLECSQTGFRKAISTNENNKDILLSEKEVCGKLEICPFIVSSADIKDFTNSDFNDDYNGMCFNIENGCILAVGKQVVLQIAKEKDDLSYMPSVISIVRNADPLVQHMIVDISNQKIIVKLPLEAYYCYKQLNLIPEYQPVLNATAVIPAIVYALEEVRALSIDEREEMNEYTWYRSVKKALKTKLNCDIESDEFGQENMMVLAQQLINEPLSEAFKVLSSGVSDGGENE